MGVLILHILLWVLGTAVLGWELKRWAADPALRPRDLLWVGGLTGLVATVAPLIGAILAPPGQRIWLARDLEFWLIWLVAGLAAIFLAWRLNKIFSESQRVRWLRAESWRRDLSEDTETGLGLELVRVRLEKNLRQLTGNPKVVLRWSDQIQLPFTIGAAKPEVFSPLWTAYEDDGVHVGPLLAHEQEHIRLGHVVWYSILRFLSSLLPHLSSIGVAIRRGLEVEADRSAIQTFDRPDGPPDQYIASLERVVAPAAGSGPEAGLGHDRSNLEQRICQLRSTPRRRYDYPLAAGLLVALLLGCHASIGRVDFVQLWDLATLRIAPNYNLQSPMPGVRLRSLPGKGGVFRDGLEINTLGVHGSRMINMQMIRSLAPGEQHWVGFHCTMNIRILRRPISDDWAPVLFAETNERIPSYPRTSPAESVTAGLDHIKDIDWTKASESGTYSVAVGRQVAGPQRVTAKPGELAFLIIFVPSGWIVQITDVQLEPYSGLPKSDQQLIALRDNFFSAVPLYAVAQGGHLSWSAQRLYDFSP